MTIYTIRKSPDTYTNHPNTMDDRTPYTYVLKWTEKDTYYYGVKYAKGCHPKDLFITYMTSSYHVWDFIEKYGNPDIIKITKVFNSKLEALSHENKVLLKLDAKNHPSFLNKSNGLGEYHGDPTGRKQSQEHIQKRTSKRIGLKHSEESKSKIGKANINRITVIDETGNSISIFKSDERYTSGRCRTRKSGKFCAVDKTGKKFTITKLDSRFISGELIAESKMRIRHINYTVPTFREFINFISPRTKFGKSWYTSKELKQNFRTTDEIFLTYLKPLGYVIGRTVKFK